MKENKYLKKLDLASNYLEDASVKALASMLKESHTLLHLDLSNNRIGDDGGIPLAQALKVNNTLMYLNVRQNDMRVAGEQLAETLRKNTSILVLDFSYNNFSYKSYSYIMEALKRNQDIFKSAAGERLKKQIEDLQLNAAKLEQITQEIKNDMETQWKAEKQTVVEKKQTDGIQSSIDEEIARMQEKYNVQVAERKVAQELLNKAQMDFEKAEGQMKLQYVLNCSILYRQ